MPNYQGVWSLSTQFQNASGWPKLDGTRGIFAGGEYQTNVIDFVTISTTGNATDFGDLTVSLNYVVGGVSSSTRGVFASASSTSDNTLGYITIATAGNATDFGDLSVGRRNQVGGNSNGTRGVFAGGQSASRNFEDVIDYKTRRFWYKFRHKRRIY